MNRLGVPVGMGKNPSGGLTLRRHARYYAGGRRKSRNRRSLQNRSGFGLKRDKPSRFGDEQFHQLTTDLRRA
jgi:hypothetical protein